MNKVALSGTARKATGTKDAAQLRREKRVPCVLYGGEKTIHFSVDEAALRKVVFTPEVNSIEIDLDGSTVLAMVQEKQFHPVSDRVIHVDFVQLDENKETNARLSLRLKGQPAGVRAGGKLNQTMRKLRVKGLPGKLPSHLELDVTEMELNQTIRVSDLKFDGLTVTERPNDVVVTVKVQKKQEEAAAAPGAAPAAGAAAPAAAAKTAEAKPAAKPAAKK
jgi:large subunit ribosomal protein L25